MKIIYRKGNDPVNLITITGLFLILLFLALEPAAGQQRREEAHPLRERLFFGGSFGLQFGTFTDIEVSPVAGLWVLPRIGIAAGPVFRYYKNPYDHTTIYGGTGYIQYLFLQDFNNIIPVGIHAGLFFQLEDEALSLESAYFKNPNLNGRFLLNTILAGGGVRQPLGQRSSLNFIFLWALNDAGYGIYGNPEIRISVIF